MIHRNTQWQDSNRYLLRKAWVAAMRQGTLFTCGICLETIHKHDPLGFITVDHIVPRSKGGADEFDNYQPAHRLCNLRKGNTEPVIEYEVYKPTTRPAKFAKA